MTRLHNCKATAFGFTRQLLDDALYDSVVEREKVIQLQLHRSLVGPNAEVFYDEYTDQAGTLCCFFFSGDRAR